MSDERNFDTAENVEQVEQTAAEPTETAAPVEASSETADVVSEVVEEVVEEKKPVRVSAHNTAAAAALNAASEEVDIRRKNGEKAQRKIKTTKIPYEKKKGLYGYGFVALWAIGTLWLFIIPVLTSLWYSLCDTKLLDKAGALEMGMTSAGIYTEWNGFGNYIKAFTIDTNYLPKLTESLGQIGPQAIVILIFSRLSLTRSSEEEPSQERYSSCLFLSRPVLLSQSSTVI